MLRRSAESDIRTDSLCVFCFLIYEMLMPDGIQREVVDKTGADLKAFEHVKY